VLDDTTIHPSISKYLTQACSEYFGEENWGENGRTLKEWTGIMGYTQDGQPIVGEAPGQKGLWVCAGFNGHGMLIKCTGIFPLTNSRDGTSFPVV